MKITTYTACVSGYEDLNEEFLDKKGRAKVHRGQNDTLLPTTKNPRTNNNLVEPFGV